MHKGSEDVVCYGGHGTVIVSDRTGIVRSKMEQSKRIAASADESVIVWNTIRQVPVSMAHGFVSAGY